LLQISLKDLTLGFVRRTVVIAVFDNVDNRVQIGKPRIGPALAPHQIAFNQNSRQNPDHKDKREDPSQPGVEMGFGNFSGSPLWQAPVGFSPEQ
jgi:hypothetical protein